MYIYIHILKIDCFVSLPEEARAHDLSDKLQSWSIAQPKLADDTILK